MTGANRSRGFFFFACHRSGKVLQYGDQARRRRSSATRASPRIVSWLGYGGLIPFLAFAVLAWTDHERSVLWHQYLLDYGAVILSFVGAVHWGMGMAPDKMAAGQRNVMFAWSVVPSGMAFFALAAHSPVGEVLLVSGFLLHYAMDLRTATQATLPRWYLPLRLRLSVIAIICLAAGAFARSA